MESRNGQFASVLTCDGLDTHTQKPSHLAFLRHYRHAVHQGHGVQEVAQVHKCSKEGVTVMINALRKTNRHKHN